MTGVEDSTRGGNCLGRLAMLPFLVIGVLARAVTQWRR